MHSKGNTSSLIPLKKTHFKLLNPRCIHAFMKKLHDQTMIALQAESLRLHKQNTLSYVWIQQWTATTKTGGFGRHWFRFGLWLWRWHPHFIYHPSFLYERKVLDEASRYSSPSASSNSTEVSCDDSPVGSTPPSITSSEPQIYDPDSDSLSQVSQTLTLTA